MTALERYREGVRQRLRDAGLGLDMVRRRELVRAAFEDADRLERIVTRLSEDLQTIANCAAVVAPKWAAFAREALAAADAIATRPLLARETAP